MITSVPDFAEHAWRPIASAQLDANIVTLTWDDGAVLECYSLWLLEQSVGIEPLTREGTLEPSAMPEPTVLSAVALNADGSLRLGWNGFDDCDVHPGWLHSIATDRHVPIASLGALRLWTAADFAEPPTYDGSIVLSDHSVFEAWLGELCTTGLGRLRNTPATDEFLSELAERIGPIRGSNFGGVFTVESIVAPDSTANTGLALGQHTDLPTRETPPGFQFLHCVENSVPGGFSRMADGLSVVDEIRRVHPDAYDALTTLDWVFANRGLDADHRWIGPIIDFGGRGQPLTLRAFYPVRLAPHMPLADQPRAYAALRVFSQVAHDPRFMITSPFEPGDLVGFDNRRILHGRDAFDPGAGQRRLRGCYIDHDDVYSRLRVLRRPATDTSAPGPQHTQGTS
jgi:gamma-butyrobetaine dioxygenase